MFHIETSHLFFRAKQMAGFYMKRNAGQKWVKPSNSTSVVSLSSIAFILRLKKLTSLGPSTVNRNLIRLAFKELYLS